MPIITNLGRPLRRLFRRREPNWQPMWFGAGMLDAPKGRSPEKAHANRLDEIERRILALEAKQ